MAMIHSFSDPSALARIVLKIDLAKKSHTSGYLSAVFARVTVVFATMLLRHSPLVLLVYTPHKHQIMTSALQLNNTNSPVATPHELAFRAKARAFRTSYPRQIKFVASNNCNFHDLVYRSCSAGREREMLSYLALLAEASWHSAANCASRDACDVLIMILCFSCNGEDGDQTIGDFVRLNFQGAELSQTVLSTFPFQWTKRDIGTWTSVAPSNTPATNTDHTVTVNFQVPLSYFG